MASMTNQSRDILLNTQKKMELLLEDIVDLKKLNKDVLKENERLRVLIDKLTEETE